MSSENHKLVTAEDARDVNQKVDKSRRAFAKVGVAAPVIITLASRPALGSGGPGTLGDCFSPSKALSKNTSLSGGAPQCEGQSPGYWKNSMRTFPSPLTRTTLFHPLFAEGAYVGNSFKKLVGSNYVSMTLDEVLNLGGTTDKQMVAFHVVAALLNFYEGWVDKNAITDQGIKDIWAEYAADGSYSPVASVNWLAADIKSYLINNHIVK